MANTKQLVNNLTACDFEHDKRSFSDLIQEIFRHFDHLINWSLAMKQAHDIYKGLSASYLNCHELAPIALKVVM